MGKTLKVLGWLVGMLVVLVIAAVILIPMFVDPNDHKDRIVAEVKKATGRDLSISGDIGLSVFPRLALELNGLRLSNAPGFNGSEFASIKHAQVRVNLLPLLFKQLLEVDTVQVDGVRLNLAKSKSGATNWEDMTGKKAQKEVPSTSAESKSEGGMNMLAFTVGGLNISEASVVWNDQSTGERYTVEDIQLETGELAPGEPVDVQFSLALASQKPAMQGKLALTTVLVVNPDNESVKMEGLDLDVEMAGEGLPEKGVVVSLTSDVLLNLSSSTLDIQNLLLESGKIKLTGHLQGIDIQSNPSLKGDIKLAEFSPREWMKQFGMPIPDTADPDVLESLHFSTDFSANAEQAVLTNLMAEVDQTTLKGNFEIVDLASPTYLFNLDVNSINLDRYLPPPSESSPPPARQKGKQKGAKEEPLFPTELLRQLKLNGTIRIGNLIINNLNSEAILVKIRSRDGKLNIDHEIGRFYDGLIKGDIQLDVMGTKPILKLNQSVSRILSGPLLKDLTGEDTLLGSGDLEMALSSKGETVTQLKKALNGDVSFDFRDGAVKGFNLAKMIRDTKARLKGEPITSFNEPEQTDFSELTGKAKIVNGVVNNQILHAKSPYFRLEGSGKAYLSEERLKYTVRPVIVNTSTGQDGKALEDLKGIPIPVKIKGDWNDPEFSIQLSKILEEQQKAKLKKKLDEKIDEKVTEELEEKLPEELQDQLKDKLKSLL
ncbi:MAG: AsmA family protein [Candidatus Thiodiazotropha sp. LLP2]